MGTIFTLSPAVVSVARQAITDLISQLGKPCKLVWPPMERACPNCVLVDVGNQQVNRWVSGGPVPFPDGQACPACNGVSFRAEEVTRPITLLIANSPSQWFLRPSYGVQIPDGTIQTKGFVADLPYVLQARQLLVETPADGLARWRYFLAGEPLDVGNIVQGSFFVAVWRRGGG